jgi:hypothetical protein
MLAGALALIGLGMGLCSVGFAQEMCSIQGEQGACKIEAFLGSESKNDRDAFTCTKLSGIKYKGACHGGSLDGMVLLHRPANRRVGRHQDEQFLTMVKAGQVQFPVAIFSEQIVGVMGKDWSTGCVNFAQGWDKSTDKSCALLTNAFGSRIIKRDTWRAVRTGKFDHQTAEWNAAPKADRPNEEAVRGDAPKTVGVGARGD